MSSVDELPIGTVTFLFTDIEGSTKLLKHLGGERYGDVLTRHQLILREVFAESGGHEIDTQGDSFFVAFRRAKEALSAAIACQRRLAEHSWSDGAELRVRIGIHTGEPALGGTRYVGLGVHRAARICAAGHGGQVLVSQTTRELLRDDPISDVTLRDLGEHQLKDLDEPEHLYQVVATGLREDFPELTAAASAPFEGRAGELAEAAAEEMAEGWRRPRRRVLVGAAIGVAIAGRSSRCAPHSWRRVDSRRLDHRELGRAAVGERQSRCRDSGRGYPRRDRRGCGCDLGFEYRRWQRVSRRSAHERRPADDHGRRWPHGPGRHTSRGLGGERPRRNCLADRYSGQPGVADNWSGQRSERRRVRRERRLGDQLLGWHGVSHRSAHRSRNENVARSRWCFGHRRRLQARVDRLAFLGQGGCSRSSLRRCPPGNRCRR